MVANGSKDWRAKEAELRAQLKLKLNDNEHHWLQTSVSFDAPELSTIATADLEVYFPGNPKEPPPRLNDAQLIRTFIWQCWCKIAAGVLNPVRGNIRSFWYQFMEGFYHKHGLLGEHVATRWREDDDGPAAVITERMTAFFMDFVRHRVFWYRDEFLFQEPIESKKKRGVDRPGILFFTEKEGLWWLCDELYKAKGKSISVMASNGQPSLLNLEYYVADLSKKTWKLNIGAMCDFDPWGFAICGALDEKMRFLLQAMALEKARQTGEKAPKVEVTTWMLTGAELFTPEQISQGRDYSKYMLDPAPGEPPMKEMRSLIRNWVARSGGVNGKPIAMHVDVVDDELKRKRSQREFVKVLLEGKKPKLPTVDPAFFVKLKMELRDEVSRGSPVEGLSPLQKLFLS